MTKVTLTRPGKPRRWLQLYRLYLAAFPAAERKPFSMILGLYRKGKTDIWAVESAGKFRGLAITINSPRIILLDYLAVCESARGQGVGTAVLAQLQQIYSGKGFFLEIESTHEAASNQLQRQNRKRFYLAAGLEEMHTEAMLFGVRMELLGKGCRLDFTQYRNFYRDNYNAWAAEHITEVPAE